MKKSKEPLTEKVQIRVTQSEFYAAQNIAEAKSWSLSQVFREAFKTAHIKKGKK